MFISNRFDLSPVGNLVKRDNGRKWLVPVPWMYRGTLYVMMHDFNYISTHLFLVTLKCNLKNIDFLLYISLYH